MSTKLRTIPKDLRSEIAGCPDDDLLSRFPGHSRSDLRRWKREVIVANTPSDEEQFTKFLIKGRTLKQLKERFGDKTEELLAKKFEGVEPVYSAKPLQRSRLHPPPRTAEGHRASSQGVHVSHRY